MFIDYSPSPSIFIYYSSDVTPFSSSHRDSDFRKTAVRSESMINELSQIGIIKRNEDTRGNSTPTWNFSQVRKSPLCTNFHLNVHLRKKKIKTPRTRSKEGRKEDRVVLSLGAGGWRDRTWPPTLTFALERRMRGIACARNVPSRPTLVERTPLMWSTV